MEADSIHRVKMQNELGVQSEYLTPADIKARFPYIDTFGVKSGSFHKLDGIAEPAKLLEIYAKGAKENGVRFEFERNVEKIVKEGERVTGIETSKGPVKCDTVILAAGPQSKDLCEKIDVHLPMEHKRKYVVVIDGFPFDFPVIMEIPTGWYIKKENHEALVGMSGKHENVDYQFQQETVDETIEATMKRLPDTENFSINKVMSTMSDETHDKHAIIDHHIPGLMIVTGFSGHGFMHSPAVGMTVTSLIKEEKPKLDVSELRLFRSHIKEPIAI